MKPWPTIREGSQQEIVDFCRYISRSRQEDVAESVNFYNIFIQGRKVGKIPSSSADVVATDRVGDFNYSDSYLYLCVDSGGSAVWRRVALGSW